VNPTLIPAPPLHSLWWILPAAYLLGSIPFGKFLARTKGIIRLPGGSIDAADVAREAGLAAGIATMLLDAAKGFLAVWLAAHFTQGDVHWMMDSAMCVILGHIAPIWLRFRGGRGVATAAGAFLGICWPAVAIAFSVWLLVLWFWGYLSLASISAAAAFPMLMYILYAPGHAPPDVVSFGTLLLATIVVLRHRPNIKRLLSGTEPRFGPGRPKDAPDN
jgi:acyl phosphate:glycerol-3-phosphate acyltransferase